jgi:hypothetical protein
VRRRNRTLSAAGAAAAAAYDIPKLFAAEAENPMIKVLLISFGKEPRCGMLFLRYERSHLPDSFQDLSHRVCILQHSRSRFLVELLEQRSCQFICCCALQLLEKSSSIGLFAS